MLSSPVKSLRIILVSMFTMFAFSISAQTNKDSLAYYESKISRFENLTIDSISYYCDKGRKFSDDYHKIRFLRIEADFLKKNGNKNKAYQKLQKAFELLKNVDSIVLEGQLYFDLSNFYYHFNQFSESYEYILKSKSIFVDISQEEIDKFNRIYGRDFTAKGFLQPILFNIGIVALDNGDVDVTEKHLKEYLQYSLSVGDSQGVIDAKINLASLWSYRKDYEKCIEEFVKVLEENELSAFDSSIAYYNMASSSFELENYKDAERYINVSISLSEKINDCVQLIDLYLLKAKILMKQGRHKEALPFLENSLHESVRIGDFVNNVVLYKNLAKCEALLGHKDKSIHWYERMVNLSDSIHGSKEEEYNLYKKINLENKILLQKSENKRHLETIDSQRKQKQLLVASIILGILLFVALLYLFNVNKKNNHKRIELIKQQVQIDEAKLEKSRILEEIETRQIQEDLKVKKRELTLLLLHSKKRNTKLNQIVKEFDKLKSKSIIKKTDVEKLREYVIVKSKELDVGLDIQNRLVNSQDDFFVQLLEDYPNLSKTEIRVLAFMRVGLSTKEIAETQYVSIDAIRKTRYRIRKKLNLDPKASLEKFVMQY